MQAYIAFSQTLNTSSVFLTSARTQPIVFKLTKTTPEQFAQANNVLKISFAGSRGHGSNKKYHRVSSMRVLCHSEPALNREEISH
jgi:hypothetical protein